MVNVDPHKLPQHIAIIMDGNGRWAERHSLGRIAGHRRGAEAVKTTVKACRELSIRYLTLFAFSSENWLRPDEEVAGLMRLLGEFLRYEIPVLLENDICLKAIGNLSLLNSSLRQQLDDAVRQTAGNKGLVLILALSYGGQDEILQAVRDIALRVKNGILQPEEITKEIFADSLSTRDIPDPDLIIRTSGEYRLSNFLLWQAAYAELFFTDVLWPDFSREDLLEAIAVYQSRQRRFGLTGSQVLKD